MRAEALSVPKTQRETATELAQKAQTPSGYDSVEAL